MKQSEIDKLYIKFGKHYKKIDIKRFADRFGGQELIVMLSYAKGEFENNTDTAQCKELEKRHGGSWDGYRTRLKALRKAGAFELYPIGNKKKTVSLTLRLPENIHIRLKERSDKKDISINKLINTAIKRMLRQ